jgi:integrase/recombinase XerD
MYSHVGEEHGHRVLRVVGMGGKVVLVPLPAAVGRAIDRAVGERGRGPVPLEKSSLQFKRHIGIR